MIGPVLSAGWLQAHRGEVVVADVRWYLDGRSGRAAHAAGHLPGAVFVDLDRWLAAPPSAAAGRHPLPDPEVFAAGMSSLGIGDETVVVAYDDAGGVIAARLVWMLRVTGRAAALLDGGLRAWPGPLESGPLESVPVESVPVESVPVESGPADAAPQEDRPGGGGRGRPVFTPRPWPSAALADLPDVLDRGAEPGRVLLDARERERYRGDVEPVDPRGGHVPGARNLPCRENLTADATFLPVPELRERFAAVGVTAGADVVSSCGSGVTACHTLLALEHAGLGAGRLFPGSWSQYSANPALPAATGDHPGDHRGEHRGEHRGAGRPPSPRAP